MSSDSGDSWQMVRSLWDHPKRKMWMGGGADLPGAGKAQARRLRHRLRPHLGDHDLARSLDDLGRLPEPRAEPEALQADSAGARIGRARHSCVSGSDRTGHAAGR